MRLSTAAFGAAALMLAAPSFAQNTPAGSAGTTTPGVIQSFDGKTVTMKTDDGSIITAKMMPNTTVTFGAKRTLADIKPGDFIASGGTLGPDGKIRADEIRIFSAPGGEGQYPMVQPGHVMTNATVKQIMTGATVKQVGEGSGAPVIKLSFHGAGAPGSPNCTGRAAAAPGGAGTGCIGETEFEVPANVSVVAVAPGNISMIKVGAKARITVAKDADGTSSIPRIMISQ